MAGADAHKWIAPAILGESVPESNRTEFSWDDVQGGHGSANIPLLQAACAGWYWFHRDRAKANKVLDAWDGYLNLDYWMTKEPYSSHRYGTWITMSYEAVRALAVELNRPSVVQGLERYLRFEMFLTALSAGWTRNRGTGSQRRYPYVRGGARSNVGWDGDFGKGSGDLYEHLAEDASIGVNYGNALGLADEANWEVEPIFDALEDEVNFDRFDYLSDDELELMVRITTRKNPLDAQAEVELEELLGLMVECNVRIHIVAHVVRTTEGVAWIAEKSWASGSTSFMMGKVWYRDGRSPQEYPEPWAGMYDNQFGWLYSGCKTRRADPGGEGSIEWDGDKYILKARTNPGECSNDFIPGPNKHWRGWPDSGAQDPAAWLAGPRVVTLEGERISHVKINKRGIEMVYPDGDPTPPDPGPGPNPGNGKGAIKRARILCARSEAKWGTAQGVRLAEKAKVKIDRAIELYQGD